MRNGIKLRFPPTLIVAVAVALSAQSPLPPGEVTISGGSYLPAPHFEAETNLVQLTVRVSDARGRPVRGLSRAIFTVYDDGQPQALVSFAEQTGVAIPAAASQAAKPGRGTLLAAPGAAGEAARSIALYFDDRHTNAQDMMLARRAAATFVGSDLGPGDRVGVFTGSIGMTSEIGLDRTATLAALAKLGSHPHMALGGEAGDCPRITPDQAYLIEQVHDPDAFATALGESVQCNCIDTGNTVVARNRGGGSCANMQAEVVHSLADEIWAQAQRESQATLDTIGSAIAVLARQPAPRLLVVGSAGFLTGTFDQQIAQLVQSALRSDVLIESLDAKGLVVGDRAWGDQVADIHPDLDPLELRQALTMVNSVDIQASSAVATGQPTYDTSRLRELGDLTDGMSALARGTGGELFWNSNDLAGGYRQVTAPPAGYLLAFAPAAALRDGKFHALQVKVASPQAAHIRARSGYYADSGTAAAMPDALDAAVLSDQLAAAIPLQVATEEATGAAGLAALRVEVAVDVNRLPFAQQQGRSVETLSFAAVLFNASGAAVAGKQAKMQLRLQAASLAQLSRDGLRTSMTLTAAPGSYRLREVVIENNTGLTSVRDEQVTLR